MCEPGLQTLTFVGVGAGVSVGLTEEEALRCFCEHYQSVLDDPDGDSHKNIRNLMKHGWEGVVFENPAALTLRSGF